MVTLFREQGGHRSSNVPIEAYRKACLFCPPLLTGSLKQCHLVVLKCSAQCSHDPFQERSQAAAGGGLCSPRAVTLYVGQRSANQRRDKGDKPPICKWRGSSCLAGRLNNCQATNILQNTYQNRIITLTIIQGK